MAMATPEYDVIIVGAGVAGASLATVLARDGRRVLVIERDLYDNPNTHLNTHTHHHQHQLQQHQVIPHPACSPQTSSSSSSSKQSPPRHRRHHPRATRTTTTKNKNHPTTSRPSRDPNMPTTTTTTHPTTPIFSAPDRIVGELLQPGGCAALRKLDLHNALDNIDAQPVYGYGVFLNNSAIQLCYSGPQISATLTSSSSDLLIPSTTTTSDIFSTTVSPTDDDLDHHSRPKFHIANTTIDAATAPRSASAGAVQSVSCGGRLTPLVSGCGFHNGLFLRRLREIAYKTPNVTLMQGNVIALDKDDTNRVIGVSFQVKLPSDTPDATNDKDATGAARVQIRHATAWLTIACDGCASTLRRRASTESAVKVYSRFVGLVLKSCNLPFPNHGHVVLANPAPILFYPVSSTEVRCLVDIPSSVTMPVERHMLEVLAPQIPNELRGPFIRAVRAGGFKAMPNRVMPAVPDVVPGAVLLGDSFNMRHPITGGGMTVALSDVALIRDLLRDVPDLSDSVDVGRALKLFYEQRKPLSTTINVLANALYRVFCATDDPALVDMRDACFSYLRGGGRMSHDPMSMLAGIKPNPTLLIAHFFCVAFYGCGRVLLPCPTPSRIVKAWTIFRASFNILKPLVDSEHIFPLNLIPFHTL